MVFATGHLFADRYEIMRYIDGGTYGEVYEAIDTHQDGRLVALKLLDPAKLSGWPWQEATMLTRLDSEYVLTIYNADIDAGIPYLATELVTGGSLQAAANLPRLSAPEAIALIRGAARGLARTHDGGIVHRDVKPANLFWSANGSALVGDFGLAHPLDPNGEAPVAGTPATVAPEILNGGNATVQSDIWSLGATAYILLTGKYPHEDLTGANSSGALDRLRATRTPTPIRELAPHLSQRLASRIERCLASQPDDRYPSMTAFENDLGAEPTPARNWRENQPHLGHLRCWSCDSPSELLVCLCPGSTNARAGIEVRHASSRNRIRKHCSDDIYARAAGGRLRSMASSTGGCK